MIPTRKAEGQSARFSNEAQNQYYKKHELYLALTEAYREAFRDSWELE